MSNLFDVLNERGYIYQSTNLERVKELLSAKEPVTFYLGIDPTADSLHIGHFFALMMFRHLQDAGHKGILVIGGATALVGDPSGKSDMRKMLDREQVQRNLDEVAALAGRFIITEGENAAIILNNADWFNVNYVEFMRTVGIHFNVSKMLAADAYANRLKSGGLTFLEMGYMLMQAYDFVYLNKTYGCCLQIGGSDQWGNIVAGTGLNRKMNFLSEDEEYAGDIFGLTCPLLLTKEGKKMGKTESGTLWVAREKTAPYDFYQYFYNVNDCDTEMLLKLFTRVSVEEINRLVSSDIIAAKKLMAYEITKLVHGKDEADKVVVAAQSLFKGGSITEDVPTAEYSIANGDLLIDIAAATGFTKSKSESRRLVEQGGFYINGEKVISIDRALTADDYKEGFFILKKGKKNFIKIIVV